MLESSSLNVGFQFLAERSPKTFIVVKKYEAIIIFPPEKFSKLYPSSVEPLKQYTVHSTNRICSRVLGATASLKAGSTENADLLQLSKVFCKQCNHL